MDPEILRQFYDHLLQGDAWDEWGQVPWLRSQFGLDYAAARAYQAEGVRQWGLAQQRLRPALTADDLPADLRRRLQARQATPADWAAVLQTGLYLERRRVLLAWGAPLACLERTSPDQTPAGPSIQTWRDEAIFGGLLLEISTGSLFSSRGLYRLNCKPADYQINGDLDQGLQPELEHLRRALGEPNWGDYAWKLGGTLLGLQAYSPNDFYSNANYHKYLAIERQSS